MKCWKKVGRIHRKPIRKGIPLFLAGTLACMLLFLCAAPFPVQAATVQKVKIGHALSVVKAGAEYSSSDEAVAYVTADGRVIGKKKGMATVTVTKGKSVEEVAVKVVANAKKPSIYVCVDEIVAVDNQITFPDANGIEEEGESAYLLTYTMKNNSQKTADRVIITGRVGEEEISFTAKKLAAGEEMEFVHEGTADSTEVAFEPMKIQVYSHGMNHTYSYTEDKYFLRYATLDTEAPVISGFVGKNSFNGDIPYQVVYSEDAQYFDYFKYVSAEDDRDTDVVLGVDTSGVDFDKTGTYRIQYIATDSEGNESTASAKIGIRVETKLDRMCDAVLESIIESGWSDTEKAKAIYKYTRTHISYAGHSDKSSWEKEAERGIRCGRGDCFTYYSVARALLTRAGIVNIEMRRVNGHSNHWWNMVYVQGAFYHFDACPRRAGGNFCLVTDAQLKAYSQSHGNSHIWDYKNKPKSGTKVISSVY